MFISQVFPSLSMGNAQALKLLGTTNFIAVVLMLSKAMLSTIAAVFVTVHSAQQNRSHCEMMPHEICTSLDPSLKNPGSASECMCTCCMYVVQHFTIQQANAPLILCIAYAVATVESKPCSAIAMPLQTFTFLKSKFCLYLLRCKNRIVPLFCLERCCSIFTVIVILGQQEI